MGVTIELREKFAGNALTPEAISRGKFGTTHCALLKETVP